MKGYRFYEEFQSKHRRVSAGNIIAIDLDDRGAARLVSGGRGYDATAAIYDHPNSDVCHAVISPEFLWKKCRSVSEQRAREVHPKLFAFLDSFEERTPKGQLELQLDQMRARAAILPRVMRGHYYSNGAENSNAA